MNLHYLPEEIILAIAKLLPHSDLIYFSSASKCFRRICFPLYSSFKLILPNCDLSDCFETWFDWGHSKILLDLRSGIPSDDEVRTFELIKHCTELEIINGSENWEKLIFQTIKNSKIKSIKINSSICHIQEAYHQNPFDVSFIKSQLVYPIEEGKSHHDRSFIIGKFCQSRTFKVSSCINISEKAKRIDDYLLNAMMCTQHKICMSTLSHLVLDGSNISDEAVFLISNCYPYLLSLSLNNCSNLSSNTVNAVGKMVNLQGLSIAGLRDLKSIVQLSHLHNLRNLDISNCKQLNDISGLMELINNFVILKLSGIPASLEILTVFDLQNLKELDIQSCYQVSDSLLGRLKLPNLRAINLSSCVRVTDKMLQNVICGSDSLTSVNLSWLKKITPGFFQETSMVSKIFWRIKKLDLCNMNINDDCLSIIQSCLPMSLHSLHVGMCKEITDKGLLKIAQIPTMKFLDLSHLCKITDIGIKIVANRLYRLRELKITGCIGITNEGIVALKVCRYLYTLECAQCSKITNEAVDELIQALPKLQNVVFVKKITVVL